MTIDVELLSRDAALVIAKPSWFRRVVFGDRSDPAVAVRGPVVRGVQLWRYEDTQRLCSGAVTAAIEEAAFFARLRSHLVRVATAEPPS